MSSTELDTRERILKETWRLMEQKHGSGVRLEDIAKAARVSRQAIYLHFGSRAGLLIATARYLDETQDHLGRTQHIRNSEDGCYALNETVEFWAGYIPEIYGLAKALMNARATDPDAASAWDDRMAVFYGKCQWIAGRLHAENRLKPEWSVEAAADYLWAALSIANWEHLTKDRGWSQQEYVERLQTALKAALILEQT